MDNEDKSFKFITNAFTTLRHQVSRFLAGLSEDGERDIYDIYKYPRFVSFGYFLALYKRQDIAKRIINMLPRSCWRDGVEVKENEKLVLVEELKILRKRGLYDNLERADILNRLGNFSVMYVGIPGQDPALPLETMTIGSNNLNKVFFQPYAMDGVIIDSWEKEVTSERFNKPVMYSLTVMSRVDNTQDVQKQTIKVHWSRLVHLAEGALDSGLEGFPALEAIVNRLVDLNKTVGGAAEAFFRNSRNKLALETNKDFKGAMSDEAKTKLDTAVSDFQNQWQDVLKLHGMTAKTLTSPHADPEQTVMAAVKMISGETGIPIRILLGEGPGQLAGAEDRLSYNNLIDDRQKQWCYLWITRVFEILNDAGLIKYLPSYEAEFPINESTTEKEKAETIKLKSEAVANISNAIGPMGGLSGELSAEQVITEILMLEYKPEVDGADPVVELEEVEE